ncbi:MAG: alpha/beta hydrolase, partial [Burkholderiales bacterium]|nr:alpha/beta hydrolase [Burkholderiales bacterium]
MTDPIRRTLLMSLAGGLAGCAATEQRPPAAPAAGGRFIDYPAFASRFVAPRRVRVWLPPDAGRERLAVLYMQDGQNVFDPPSPIAKGAWEVDRQLLALRRARAVRPTMVVAVWNTEDDRAREYAPQAAIESLPAAVRALVLPAGGAADAAPLADAYVRFLATELKPYIDAHYRTRPGRDDTFLMGSSMGGLISLYALASYPQVYGGAACLSTHWVITTNFGAFADEFAPGGGGDARVDRMAAAYVDWL